MAEPNTHDSKEVIKKILEVVDRLPSPDKPMGSERSRVAAGIAMNPEWGFYVATETDRLLREMACENYEGMTAEQVGMKVLASIGEISALGKAHQHFSSSLADSRKEDAETEEEAEEAE